MFILSEQTIWINTVSQTVKGSLGAAPLIPREKGELDLRELLLIAAGTLLGSCLGVTMMCLFQINKDCRVKRKEDTDYEKEKHSEDCTL